MVELIHGDMMEEVDRLPENSVDVVMTDAPYNISKDAKDIEFAWREDIKQDFGDWDEITPFEWVPKVARVLEEDGALLSFYDYWKIDWIRDAMLEAGMERKQCYGWCKSNPAPIAFDDRMKEGLEIMVIGTMGEGTNTPFHRELKQRNNYTFKSSVLQGDEHPTGKPKEVFVPLIRYWTNKDSTILDPFMGAGTIPSIAVEMGRDVIGIEQDEKFYEEASKRVRKAQKEREKHESHTGVYVESVEEPTFNESSNEG